MNKLTIFSGEKAVEKDVLAAIKSLVTGQTPIIEVREKDGRSGKERYVNGYYMFRQASLLTGWRWSSKCLREKYVPSEEDPKEVGALMEITLFDQEGHSFSHQSWGSSAVHRYEKDGKGHKAGDIISLFDALKSAYTDGIKKNLSYFGIANDIYGGKELNYFEENNETGQTSLTTMDTNAQRTVFDAYIKANHVRYDIVLRLLNAQSLNDVTDFTAAYKTVKEWIEGGRK